MKSQNIRGFTLIELMLVISIISLLSSLTFSSLTIARAKAQDAGTMETLGNVRHQATLQKNSGGTYVAAFTAPDGKSYVELQAYASQQNVSASQYGFKAGADEFAVAFPFKSKAVFWCVDAEGVSKEVGGMPNAGPPYNCSDINTGAGSGPNTPPVITLMGGTWWPPRTDVLCSASGSFVDTPGVTYTASDNEDGNITSNVLVVDYVPNPLSHPNFHDKSYTVTDSGGLVTQVIRPCGFP